MIKTNYYLISAAHTGDLHYEDIWGDYQRVYTDADDARAAASMLTELRTDAVEYYADEADADDEVTTDMAGRIITVASHHEDSYVSILDGQPGETQMTKTTAVTIDTAKALRAGANYIAAIHLDGDDYAYYAAETCRWYLVSRDEIVNLGRRLLAHDKDAYSFWCADGHGAEVGDLDHDTLDRIAQAGRR